MSSKPTVFEFPSVEAKLQKPAKQSAFEKQKAEAEAKRQREAAETAAVYEDFVKSFDHDSDDDDAGGFRGGQPPAKRPRMASGPGSLGPGPAGGVFATGYAGGGGSAKRHFGAPSGQASMMKSGPGSLGPAPTSFGRKKSQENFWPPRKDGHGSSGTSATGGGSAKAGLLGFDDYDDGERLSSGPASAPKKVAVSKAFASEDSDDSDYSGGERGGHVAADGNGPSGRSRAEEKATARPTLRLANLPPGMSQGAIKALLPGNLVVEGVKLVPPVAPSEPGSTSTERKSTTAIVTLSKETPAAEMDAAVSALQNQYLGYGYHLSINRHLSSAVSSSVVGAAAAAAGLGSGTGGSGGPLPFGARPVPQTGRGGHHGHHQFYGRGGRGIAPPSSLGTPGFPGARGGMGPNGTIYHVPVRPPRDIRQLRLIHAVVEAVLEFGPELEALLMSRPEVARDERWSWLWDARSEGGVWYRWRLWELVTGYGTSKGSGSDAGSRGTRGSSLGGQAGGGRYLPVFEDSHAWRAPDRGLPFEWATAIDEFVSDDQYDSSEDDDDHMDGHDTVHGGGAANASGGTGGGPGVDDDPILNPLEKARLTHLLARLPTSLVRLRKGDLARITAFAITHASRGADEVVDLIVSNIEHPFSLAAAAAAARHDKDDKSSNDNHLQKRDRDGASDNHHQNRDHDGSSNNNDQQKRSSSRSPDRGSHAATGDGTSSHGAPPPRQQAPATAAAAVDPSTPSLIGLYVVSDVLSASSSGAARRAWRYRSLFETALKRRKVFDRLGRMAERLGWGRLRAEKWRRSVGLVLSLWEGWCVFPAETQEAFVKGFENPAPDPHQPSAATATKAGAGGDGGGVEEYRQEPAKGHGALSSSGGPGGWTEEGNGQGTRLRIVEGDGENDGMDGHGSDAAGRRGSRDRDGEDGEEDEDEEMRDAHEDDEVYENEEERVKAILAADEEYVDEDQLSPDVWDDHATDGYSFAGSSSDEDEDYKNDDQDWERDDDRRPMDLDGREAGEAGQIPPRLNEALPTKEGRSAGADLSASEHQPEREESQKRVPKGSADGDGDSTGKSSGGETQAGAANTTGELSQQEAKAETAAAPVVTKSVGGLQVAASAVGGARRRMRAVDMFASSDDED